MARTERHRMQSAPFDVDDAHSHGDLSGLRY
jgi:hypothetical protein